MEAAKGHTSLVNIIVSFAARDQDERLFLTNISLSALLL